jgi:hypothetical protein
VEGGDPVFRIVASIEGGFDDPDVICAFDPTKVVARLRQEFPGLQIDPKDYAWRDHDTFLRMGPPSDDVMRVAMRDAQRRGPVWMFRLPVESGAPVDGRAERHYVHFHSEGPFPEPLRSRLLRFVAGLRFAPCVRVKCVRLEGNDEHPA